MTQHALGLLEERELLDFSQNFAVNRNYVGARLFPDRKTQYLQAEYYRAAKNGTLPMIAEVHAFDTEAKIGSRVPFERVELEKLLIKEKINQTEALEEMLQGMRMDGIRRYIFDDVAREAEKVVTRVEKAKIDALTQGKYVITENNLSIVVDYGVPEDNKVKAWWDEDADILGDITKWVDQAADRGPTPTRALTTRAVMRTICANKSIQMKIFGANAVGTLPSFADVNAMLDTQIGITIEIDEDRYATDDREAHRFFPDNVFVLYAPGTGGAFGEGLWGMTPEERRQSGGAFSKLQQQQYVTVTQWETPDPVAVWTKASGLFVPVLPNVYSLMIANVADVSSKPEATLPSSVSLPLSVENGGTGASAAQQARENLEVYSKQEVDAKTAG